MNRKIEITLFASVFFIIYFIMNLYVIHRYYALFNVHFNYGAFIAVILISMSYLIAMFLENYMGNEVTRLFYIFSTVWFGFLFISLSMLIIYEIINFFLHINNYFAGVTVLSLSIILSIYGIINQGYIVVNKITIPMKNVKRNIRIVQLSDLHLGTYKSKKYFDKIVEKINLLKPDMVAVTGDIVDGSASLNNKMLSPLNKIKADIFYISGNHEIYEGLDKVIALMKKTKAKILRKNLVNYKGIQIIGMDYKEDKKEFVKTLNEFKIKKNKPSILLYHAPEDISIIEKKGIDLHLAGHTHGGQIFPFNLFVRLAYKNVKGLRKSNNTYQYTSMGVNVWGPPMRLGSRDELAVIEIVKKKD